MTKQDRAKMEGRVDRLLQDADWNHIRIDVFDIIVREVTRAVRAERRAQRDTEELWASHRRQADEQLIERAKGLGRKRA